jgi:hypothetical protein
MVQCAAILFPLGNAARTRTSTWDASATTPAETKTGDRLPPVTDGTADGILDLAVWRENRGDAVRIARGYRGEVGVKGVSEHLLVRLGLRCHDAQASGSARCKRSSAVGASTASAP